MARLEGKVAIVSGAASGMGAEEARLFAQEGAKVVLTDVTEDDGRKVEAQIHETRGEAAFINADVTQEGDWARVIEETLSRFGEAGHPGQQRWYQRRRFPRSCRHRGVASHHGRQRHGRLLGDEARHPGDDKGRRRVYCKHLFHHGVRRGRFWASRLPRVEGGGPHLHQGDGGQVRPRRHQGQLGPPGLHAADADI